MVRSTHKVNIFLAVATTIITSAFAFGAAYADNPANVKLQVNIIESLTVSVTDPDTWASGDLDNTVDGKLTSDFLRNKVNVTAATNNGKGVNVYMYTLNNNLQNLASSATIPTLETAKTVENFDVNHWGYSLKYTEAGNGTANPTGDEDILKVTATYNPVPQASNTVKILDTTSTGTGSQDVFFGAKGDETIDSGTYARTVYFAAVTGEIDTDPVVPVNPSAEDNPVDDIAYYNTNNTGNTTYTTTTRNAATGSNPSINGASTTTTTDTGAGDITDFYAKAAGVTAVSGEGTGRAVGIALAVAAATSAASGFFFIILAKRKKDEDEEEEEIAE